ncbi:MAG: beta-lactamase family protein [Flavobacteriaceae bacterium]
MKKFIKSIFVLCFISTCISCNNRDQVKVELNAIFEKEFSADKPGGAFLLKKGNEIVFSKGYGVSDINTKEKITANTVFNTGSISKTFVANGILILNERGLLSLEDDLYKYFDDFDSKELAKKVKIKHLLSHASGLPDLRKVSDNYEFYLTAKDTANFEPLKRADSLNFQPGERFQYSNPAYNGLALIIEKITKKPWQEFIQENIFVPSGMSSSKITNGSYPDTGVSHGYYTNPNNKEIYEFDYGEVATFAAAGNGGIWSSLNDLAKYEEALQNGTFLNKDLIKKSRTFLNHANWKDSIKPAIGYSWFTAKGSPSKRIDHDFNVDFVFHTGSQGGFKAFYITIPEKDILFIGLYNGYPTNTWDILENSLKVIEKNNWLD